MFYLLLFSIVPAVFIIQQVSIAIQNLYFHPLRKYPGPRAWIAFPILQYVAQCRGIFNIRMREFHERYGPVVRFADNDLSFATAQAWKDIYGYGHGTQQWRKVDFIAPGATPHIVFSSDADHARYRKALSYGFSDNALRQQEGLITGYVDLLIQGLQEEASNGKSVDMTMWYNLTTFDIISDLAFGEASNCLQNKAYGQYIERMFMFIQSVPFIQLARFYPSVWALFKLFMGNTIKERRENLLKMGDETVQRRKNDTSKRGRADFMESMMTSKEAINDKELASNSTILFVAGSETISTALTGLTYWMLKTPDAMAKAKSEVRAAFKSEHEITFQSVSTQLPYMLACLEEGLRVYAPIPSILQRALPVDATVSGYPLPKGVRVGVHHEGTNFASYNFHRANEFIPERWLPDAMTNEKSEFFNDNRDARQPFSLGPRNCIGKSLAFGEMRQIVARLLWNFDMELVDENLDWATQKSYALRAKGPLMVTIKPYDKP